MTPQDLKDVMSSGLLSFPVTDFDSNGNFNAKGYAARLEWLAPYGASALFAAGGTGEYFSLYGEEYGRSEEHTSELQSLRHLVCRLLLEKKKKDVEHTKTTKRMPVNTWL